MPKLIKTEQENLHGKLRAFLARHKISHKQAAEFYGEDYATFSNCLSGDRYGMKKLESFLQRSQELLDSLT